ncbi:MAG: PIN domain-containing protein [Planctomycetes bacterium]|nr:PIN domain-containing protein [Planctomycetota bacterium]
MKYLLDTNTVSYYLRGSAATVKHVQGQKPSALAISAITAMELAYGAEKRGSKTLTAAVQGFLSGIQVLSFDQEAARKAGVVRAALERIGVTLTLADSQIAGHAMALDLILVSTDSAFKRVRGLTVKDWST